MSPWYWAPLSQGEDIAHDEDIFQRNKEKHTPLSSVAFFTSHMLGQMCP